MARGIPYYKGGYATCEVCQKVLYRTRKEAKRQVRYRHPGANGLSVYFCPFGMGWHYGNLPPGGREQARRYLDMKGKRDDT